MKTKVTLIIAATLALAGTSTFAAGKPCEELKSEIAAKLDAKNVTGYTLDIVEADLIKDVGQERVVDLHQNPGVDDGAIFLPELGCERMKILFVGLVVFVYAHA